MRSAEIHGLIGSNWPGILAQLRIAETYLRDRHGPCPACGGKDRFRFDNKYGRGDFFCNQHGHGDGFDLLQLVHGWTFTEARKRVMAAAGLQGDYVPAFHPLVLPGVHITPFEIAVPTPRVIKLRRACCAIENCADATAYLAGRGLSPPPPGWTLQAHPSVDYWYEGRRVGRYSALVADVVDIHGDLVTCHVTFLQNGKKLIGYEPRKLWSKTNGREGCAVRPMAAAEVLGIAEGIETALSAALLLGIPVWAATSAAFLARFEPPPEVTRLVVCGDRDEAGRLAVSKLTASLEGRRPYEVLFPKTPFKDFNDQLVAMSARHTFNMTKKP